MIKKPKLIVDGANMHADMHDMGRTRKKRVDVRPLYLLAA